MDTKNTTVALDYETIYYNYDVLNRVIFNKKNERRYPIDRLTLKRLFKMRRALKDAVLSMPTDGKAAVVRI